MPALLAVASALQRGPAPNLCELQTMTRRDRTKSAPLQLDAI